MLNKTSYQEFKKPLILGSEVWGVLPSVVFLGCLFCFQPLPGSSLKVLEKHLPQFQSSDKVGFFPQGKSHPFCYGDKNVHQGP